MVVSRNALEAYIKCQFAAFPYVFRKMLFYKHIWGIVIGSFGFLCPKSVGPTGKEQMAKKGPFSPLKRNFVKKN